ncbi:cytochrome b N-terminal domain-containing protein [Halobaculum limi]|uniref:cytochrome b N-terminal domain-containing protein n=1 Tax=Halobaculum limi TaxID=3031916 RepID=UPI00240503D0|nr:cytochrome b N-terminal domain-containing protein [Halobaculum sp. YSMS11]
MPSNADRERERPPVDLVPVCAVAVVVATDAALLTVADSLAADVSVRVGLGVGAVLATLVGVAVGTRRTRGAVVGWSLALVLALLYAYTGMILPWTEASFTLAQAGIELALSLPGPAGELVAQSLFAGFTLSAATLERAFLIHYGVATLAVVAVAVRLGVGYLGRERPSTV